MAELGTPPGGNPPPVNPVVDCHTHVFTADMPVASAAWIKPDYSFTSEDLIATLDRHGVHFAVVSGLSIAGFYNDYMIEQLRAHRRLRGTAIVPPSVDRYSLERMAADGIVGVRLQLARKDRLEDFRSDEYRLLFRRVRDLGWHVQVAIEGQQLPPVLEALLETGAKLVIDHFGHPDPASPIACAGFKAMLAAVDQGRCWIKLSGGFRLPGPAAPDLSRLRMEDGGGRGPGGCGKPQGLPQVGRRCGQSFRSGGGQVPGRGPLSAQLQPCLHPAQTP